ncbi:MAG: hypothetical protein ACN2B6_00100 [Rickettsiales bacterium]
MKTIDERRFHDDSIVEEAMHIIVDRELSGEDAVDTFMARLNDMVSGQNLTTEEY